MNETCVLGATSRRGLRVAEAKRRATAGSGVGGSACSRGLRDLEGDAAETARAGDTGAGAGDAGGVASKDVGTGSGDRGASDGRDRDGATVAVASEGAAPETFATRIKPAPFASLSRFLIHTAKSTGAPAGRGEGRVVGNGRMRRRQARTERTEEIPVWSLGRLDGRVSSQRDAPVLAFFSSSYSSSSWRSSRGSISTADEFGAIVRRPLRRVASISNACGS